MNEITVILVIKGSPPYLAESLKSVKTLATDFIIGDIGMAEKAKKMVLRLANTRIITFPYEVLYVELVREQLKQQATTEWVLFLDPDESLPPSLPQELIDRMRTTDAVIIPRKNIVFGQWIQHSRWWPDYQVRLFRKNALTWPTQLHQQPTVAGTKLSLPPEEKYAIIHHNYEDLDHFLEKERRYAKAEAQERLTSPIPFTLRHSLDNARSEFIGRYFANEGYKDGMHGLALALLQMFYPLLVYLYYWEGKKYQPLESQQKINGQLWNFFKQGSSAIGHWLSKMNLISSTEKIRSKFLEFFSK
ncbi:glycosyltransferase family 2 protein [Candidatus Roizmanbacteria bacterium]|nr:glycosyltransferase family 2 protein [Candidatus Roizmanbacteria bacterium]